MTIRLSFAGAEIRKAVQSGGRRFAVTTSIWFGMVIPSAAFDRRTPSLGAASSSTFTIAKALPWIVVSPSWPPTCCSRLALSFEPRKQDSEGPTHNVAVMEEASQIALITAGASIAGGFVGQFLSLFYQNRVSQIERVRMIEARSAQLYLREIEAYDALVPGMSGLLYVARELLREPLLKQPHQPGLEAKVEYQRIQDQVREALRGHLNAAAGNYHVIGPDAIDMIDKSARRLYAVIDEITAPIVQGPPISQERRDEIWNEMEAMRHHVLSFCWESLDVHHLESSFKKLRHPVQLEMNQSPSILAVDLHEGEEERQRV